MFDVERIPHTTVYRAHDAAAAREVCERQARGDRAGQCVHLGRPRVAVQQALNVHPREPLIAPGCQIGGRAVRERGGQRLRRPLVGDQQVAKRTDSLGIGPLVSIVGPAAEQLVSQHGKSLWIYGERTQAIEHQIQQHRLAVVVAPHIERDACTILAEAITEPGQHGWIRGGAK